MRGRLRHDRTVRRALLIWAVAMVLMFGWMHAVDEAFASPAPVDGIRDMQLDAGSSAGSAAERFRQGKLGRTAEGSFGPNVDRLAKSAYEQKLVDKGMSHKKAEEWAESWWHLMKAQKNGCLASYYAITVDDECASKVLRGGDFSGLMKETTRVTVKCGGTVIIGAVAGRVAGTPGAIWGAGTGGVTCLWGELFDRWW